MAAQRLWVLIADGGQAKVLESDRADRELAPARGMTFEAEIPAGRDILADRPGRSFDSVGAGRHAMETPSDPRRLLKRQFADMLAQKLADALRQGRFDRLVVVAPPSALGDLREALPENVKKSILSEINKDLVRTPLAELPQHLKGVLGKAARVRKQPKPANRASSSRDRGAADGRFAIRKRPRTSEQGKFSGTSQHGKGHGAPRKPSKTPSKPRVGRGTTRS